MNSCVKSVNGIWCTFLFYCVYAFKLFSCEMLLNELLSQCMWYFIRLGHTTECKGLIKTSLFAQLDVPWSRYPACSNSSRLVERHNEIAYRCLASHTSSHWSTGRGPRQLSARVTLWSTTAPNQTWFLCVCDQVMHSSLSQVLNSCILYTWSTKRRNTCIHLKLNSILTLLLW